MVRGIAVRFKSYEETIPKMLNLIKFDEEIKKHDRIILKPNLIKGEKEIATKPEFLEQVLKFCSENKNPGTEILIAEGCDGHETTDIFNELGFTQLAEKYGIGLIDLNNTETEEIENSEFLGFDSIRYPKILLDSFIISLPLLRKDEEIGVSASLDNMVGVFPAKHYKSFFSGTKNKIKKFPAKYQIHDIIKCKMPNFAVIDASPYKTIIAGQPLEMDKQAAKALGLDWRNIEHLRIIDESLSGEKEEESEVKELIEESS